MFKPRLVPTAALVMVGLIGVAAVVAGQSARSAPASDDLLAEVRGLRAEFNQAAGGSVRAQLLVARLQMQEQRVNATARQLADVQDRLASVQQGQAAMVERLSVSEDSQQRLPPEDRSDDQIRALKLQIDQVQKREQDLRTQEAALSGALAAEQSRWSEFNARLDALERSLPSPAPR
jgi:chromosome segregation ATPase